MSLPFRPPHGRAQPRGAVAKLPLGAERVGAEEGWAASIAEGLGAMSSSRDAAAAEHDMAVTKAVQDAAAARENNDEAAKQDQASSGQTQGET